MNTEWSWIKKALVRPFSSNKQHAMTLLEIIIVVSLLGVIMGIVAQRYMKAQEDAMIDLTRTQIQTLVQDLQRYRAHLFRYPTTEQGLDALLNNPGDSKKWRGPYIDDPDRLKDPWGNEFEYESDGRKVKITSAGPDGQFGTEDDITYPEDTTSTE